MENGQKPGLKREISVWGLTANLINSVIGAGIFVMPAIVVKQIGNSSLLAYLACGLFVGLVMLCFAEAGSRITAPGGAYAYIEKAFGKYAGFMAANFFIIGSVLADAAVANAVAGILSSYIPILSERFAQVIFFALIFGILALVNVIGTKQGVGLVKFITLVKLLPLLALILFGWTAVDPDNLAWQEMPSVLEIAETSLVLFFAFQGAESGLAVSGEVSNPKRNIPKAIFWAISAVLVIYILLQFIAQGILGPELSENETNPLSVTGARIFGIIGFTTLSLAAAVSMLGTLSSDILSMPRILYSATRDKVIPPHLLSKVHPKFNTPYLSIIVYALVDFILAALGGFEFLAVMSNLFVILLYLGVVLSIFRLRRNTETDEDTFVIPGGPVVPVLALLIILFLLFGLGKDELISGIAGIVILTAIFFVTNLVRSKNAS